MANPYHPPQASMTSFLQNSLQHPQDPVPLSAFSILDPGQFPESVAFWHDPTQPPHGLPATSPSYPPTSKPLLQPISDQKKHRRTRSGCFTCRSRRIKCDETRPVCDRCRKGNRDCVYPSPSAPGSGPKPGSRPTAKARGTRPQSRSSDSPSQAGSEDFHVLEPIADDGEEEEESVGSHLSPSGASSSMKSLPGGVPRKHSVQSLRQHGAKQPSVATSETSMSHLDTSSSPSTEASSRYESMSARSASVGLSTEPLSFDHLPEDLQFYLNYHREFLTFHHYFMKSRGDPFIHRTLLEFALQYEPLLYAVVGFVAYHHCVQLGTGKLFSFLKYYNMALKLLRRSLASTKTHGEATLMTVLVLTNFEECVGDWVNLIDHHQAAHALVQEVLTLDSITTNPLHGHIFLWYSRFDLIAGILAGNEVVLGREWYVAKEDHDAFVAARSPDDPDKQLALVESITRRFGLEMASLFAKLRRNLIQLDEFNRQSKYLEQMLDRIHGILELLRAPEWTVQEYPHRVPLTDDDVVDPYVPGGLLYGPYWDVNYAWIEYHSVKAMFKYQLSSLTHSPVEELKVIEVEVCRLIESIHRWPDKENGYMYAFKNCFGLSAMLLHDNPKYVAWSCHKLALLEQNGYMIPPKLRSGLAVLFQMPEINHWWLPNDEGYPPIIREIRAMTEERTNNPRDHFRESVRDLKTLFYKINIDDTESEGSPASMGDNL
ncbi:putative C6 finger domain protein [Aspergillus candidus]|uniref:Putative C6 finger domain protein n=1 Tax=Aspergillus candidus TaxID=41067 RepID=A0A2I2FAT8_ASPCN|nr:putative C6 finger domain protein [Aspergillus candidus]PLB37736.1 putative C6 finger domain protein [Aspergillus candidus]